MKAIIRTALAGALLLAVGRSPAGAEDLWKTLPDPLPLSAPDTSGFAPVNDIKMYYEIWNATGRDPVILLHGGLGSIANWGNQVPALVAKHEVIACDSRGHGRTAELAKLIPGAKLVILPNVGHMGLWQDPAAFNTAMTAFLDGK